MYALVMMNFVIKHTFRVQLKIVIDWKIKKKNLMQEVIRKRCLAINGGDCLCMLLVILLVSLSVLLSLLLLALLLVLLLIVL